MTKWATHTQKPQFGGEARDTARRVTRRLDNSGWLCRVVAPNAPPLERDTRARGGHGG
jgi:hypothetical protein